MSKWEFPDIDLGDDEEEKSPPPKIQTPEEELKAVKEEADAADREMMALAGQVQFAKFAYDAVNRVRGKDESIKEAKILQSTEQLEQAASRITGLITKSDVPKITESIKGSKGN
ncbi:hypothetical protein FH972_024899 [Carpinus fangiana]|uniref:Uncharacterized protein n=1 Tax=Carpinus fangiana TaxID=176857 RepID=A0A5N6KZF4_9ROSI|nr:hypothetical protein FH972_024899 [Carpinus fangiana]